MKVRRLDVGQELICFLVRDDTGFRQSISHPLESQSVLRSSRITLVGSPFTTSCADCYYCRKGLTARCVHGQLFGWIENGQGLDGGQAEYVRVPLAESTLARESSTGVRPPAEA